VHCVCTWVMGREEVGTEKGRPNMTTRPSRVEQPRKGCTSGEEIVVMWWWCRDVLR